MKVGTGVIRSAKEGQVLGMRSREASTLSQTQGRMKLNAIWEQVKGLCLRFPEAAWCALLCRSSSFTVIFTDTLVHLRFFLGKATESAVQG